MSNFICDKRLTFSDQIFALAKLTFMNFAVSVPISILQVTWLVVTEVRNESFGLVLHEKHIIATLQVYL